MRQFWFRFVCGSMLLMLLTPAALAEGRAKYFVLVVWDGMRPDFVSPELTPVLWSLRQQGVWFANHHAAYPSSTEVNGTVLATGVFPEHSYILANTEYRPDIDPLQPVASQSLLTVRRGDEISGGKYIAVPTVAERLRARNETTAVVGAKEVALLHDRQMRGDDSSSPVWFAEGCLPPSRLPALTNLLGVFPVAASPNIGRDQWAARCLTEAFWGDHPPRYSMLWLSEPDYSQHEHGPGSPAAVEAIRNCDDRLGAVLQALERRGLRAETDIIVVSDHGFSAIGANCDVAASLRASGFNARAKWEQPPKPGDVMVVGNGGSVLLYVIGRSPAVISNVVTTLQQQSFSGVIFTRAGLPGTFPLAEVKVGGPDAPDIIVSTRWTRRPAPNEHPYIEVFNDGYPEYSAGGGMHVTLSPTDLHNTCVAAGPDFLAGVADSLPSGNVDIAPTLLYLMNVPTERPLDGRVLKEALKGTDATLGKVELGRRDASVGLPEGTWEQHLNFIELNGVRYLDEGNGAYRVKPGTTLAH